MHHSLAIFDLDGTILDTLEDLWHSLNYALRTNACPERTFDECRRFVGNGIRKLLERAVPDGTTDAEIDRIHAAFTAYYKVHCNDHTAPYSGIPELLRTLRAHGWKTAVVSNKPDYGVQELCAAHFAGLFDAATGERAGYPKKPAPDLVDLMLEQLAVPREAAVYIGDSDVDIATAQNAGMPCISVEWGFRDEAFLLAHGACTLVKTADELQDVLLRG